MKKVLFISGTFTMLLLTLFLTGWAPADEAVKEAMLYGNQHFESADYDKALAAYETGLAANAESKSLNYNAAQAAYLLGEYEKAMEYFDKSEDAAEKFLTAGNICYRGGDAVQDINQKAQLYTQAVQYYKEGIIKYPKDVSLKYNYELAKEKLDELLENMEQENGEEGEQGEESGNQENQEQESEDGENSQGDQEQESEDANNSQSGQEQESENSENSQVSEEQDSEQDEETGDNQSQSQDSDGQQEKGDAQDEGENGADQEAVERILQMLENQEEQSLKNNQEVVGGNEGKNGW